MGLWKLLNVKSPNLVRVRCVLKLRLAAFVTVTPLPRRARGQVFSTRVCQDMRSPESSTRSVQASPDGRKANVSESAGTADTAVIAILAGAAILLPAKSRLKFPASPTTAVTPNT